MATSARRITHVHVPAWRAVIASKIFPKPAPGAFPELFRRESGSIIERRQCGSYFNRREAFSDTLRSWARAKRTGPRGRVLTPRWVCPNPRLGMIPGWRSRAPRSGEQTQRTVASFI